MKKVRTNYEDLRQNDFDEFLTNMILSLTGNAYFPALPESLVDIGNKQSDWQKELKKSKDGDHQATKKAQLIQNELCGKVRKNGNYINNEAAGDEVKLLSSGYWMAKDPVYQNRPDVKVVQGENSGTCTVVIEAIPGAICYLIDTAADPCPSPDSKDWDRQKMSSKCTIPLTDLTPRKLYWLRFCYLTVEGEADYSQPMLFSVL
jgi:hypothetical protein